MMTIEINEDMVNKAVAATLTGIKYKDKNYYISEDEISRAYLKILKAVRDEKVEENFTQINGGDYGITITNVNQHQPQPGEVWYENKKSL